MKKKILVVDDSMFMRRLLRDIVSQAAQPAPEMLEAESGTKALELVKREKPDLVLLDIIMPGGQEEGVRVLEGIMKIDPKSKVIMVTAVGQNAMIETCKQLGATDYIVKPFDEAHVLEQLAKHL